MCTFKMSFNVIYFLLLLLHACLGTQNKQYFSLLGLKSVKSEIKEWGVKSSQQFLLTFIT